MEEQTRNVPFWSLFSRVARTGFPDEELLSVYRDYGVVKREGRDDNNNRLGAEISRYQLVKPGDLVFNKMKAWQGSLGVSEFRGIVSPAYFVYAPRHEANSRYLNYVLRSGPYIDLYAANSKGIRPAQWDLQPERLDQVRVPLPRLQNQRAIADYLDHETAEIDAMSADLDEMESLLTERRSAVLTSTISRLSVKWPTPKLGTLVQMISGSGFPHRLQGQEGKELPFYKVGSLSMTGSDGTIVDDRNSISREDAATLRAHVIPDGSVLLAKIGAALLLGRFVRNAKPCCIDNNMLALIPTPEIEAKFLEHALSMVDTNVLERSGPVPTLDLGGLRQHRVPLPPLEEQHRIVDEIARETSEIDAMLADITELRDLLAERRAVVIAAAVTGQIDIPAAEETIHD